MATSKAILQPHIKKRLEKLRGVGRYSVERFYLRLLFNNLCLIRTDEVAVALLKIWKRRAEKRVAASSYSTEKENYKVELKIAEECLALLKQ